MKLKKNGTFFYIIAGVICLFFCHLMQECVPERLEIKRNVWTKVDKIIDKSVIMSSSTSALLPSAISEGLENKNRFIVSHPVSWCIF